MGCSNCNGNNNADCGCTSEELHINQICNPIVCDTEECSESFDAMCSIYSGDDIKCNSITLVTAGESMAQAVANTIAYFCNAIDNIPLKKKFVKETIFPDAESLETTILYSEYLPCLVYSEYCGTAIPSLTDITVTGYWYDASALYWTEFTHKDKSEIYIDNSGNVLVIASLPTLITYPINARIIITN